VLTLAIFCMVAYLAITRRDVQGTKTADTIPASLPQIDPRQDRR
jgi:hypothetical protein